MSLKSWWAGVVGEKDTEHEGEAANPEEPHEWHIEHSTRGEIVSIENRTTKQIFTPLKPRRHIPDPPSGWYTFGTHSGWVGGVPELEFSEGELGIDEETGDPWFERLKVKGPEPFKHLATEELHVFSEKMGDVISEHARGHRDTKCPPSCLASSILIWLERQAQEASNMERKEWEDGAERRRAEVVMEDGDESYPEEAENSGAF